MLKIAGGVLVGLLLAGILGGIAMGTRVTENSVKIGHCEQTDKEIKAVLVRIEMKVDELRRR